MYNKWIAFHYHRRLAIVITAIIMLHLQPVCSVVRTWSQNYFGETRLRISRSCSSRYSCPRGWTDWPYDQYIYSNDVYASEYAGSSSSSRSSGSFDRSQDSQNSDIDYYDSTMFYYDYHYRYVTTHRSCEATTCHLPTGKLGHFL